MRITDCRHEQLAERLVRYTVLADDPVAPETAATFWELSERHYRRVSRGLAGVVQADPVLAEAYHAVVDDNADVASYRLLRAGLAAWLRTDPTRFAQLQRLVQESDASILIDYHLDEEYQPDVPDVSYQKLHEVVRRQVRQPLQPDFDVQIVVPFRDRHGTGRLRNLLACLVALRDQAFAGDRVAVTVVETDDVPRWREVIEPLVDEYHFLPKDGLFNKSWAVNVGVRQSRGNPDLICVLDADVLVDDGFLARNTARLAAGDHSAHLYYRQMYCLDAASSNVVIAARCLRADPYLTLRATRAHVLREPPGACLWTTAAAFHAIGGFDERFEGWGGEDDDVVERLALSGPVARFDEPLLHLYHPRPQMRVDGKPFNAHLAPLRWNANERYGDPAGPGPADPVACEAELERTP